jgi:RNA polymerase sigma-70 factor (ECF subfamily)
VTSPARSAIDLAAPGARHRDPRRFTGAEGGIALGDLFRRYAPYVATIGYRLLGRDDDLDDLVQDVFIEAHNGLRQLRDAQAAKGWLARITVRRATRRLRVKRLRVFLSLDTIGDDTPLIDVTATPEERAHVASTYRWLEQLPVSERVVWILRHVQGETLDAIAALCACSKSTVQRRLRAADKKKEEAR